PSIEKGKSCSRQAEGPHRSQNPVRNPRREARKRRADGASEEGRSTSPCLRAVKAHLGAPPAPCRWAIPSPVTADGRSAHSPPLQGGVRLRPPVPGPAPAGGKSGLRTGRHD